MLQEKEKTTLLSIARRTLEIYLNDKTIPSFDDLPENICRPGGSFVTLHKEGNLRGCIGRFDSPDPLYKTVQQMAIAAATEDPRFMPVEASELSEIDIEISALSARVPVQNVNEIEVGLHGLCVSRGFYRGVLLPQVAREERWTRDEFLSHTCLKAGLPTDAWSVGGLTIETFTAEVFGERKP